MRRTLRTLVAAVQRSIPGVGVPIGEIRETIDTVHRQIHLSHSWPWSYKDFNVAVPPPLADGTISIPDQTSVVTGVGTAFPTGMFGYRIRFGNSNLDYIVSTIASPTSLTLAQPINTGIDWLASGYTLYKDTFEMPADFSPGHDLILVQPQIRCRIKHLARYAFEKEMLVLRPSFTSLPLFYTDNEYDYTQKRHTIRLCPPISAVMELRMTYRAKPPELVSLDQETPLPEGLDEVLILMVLAKLKAAYRVPGAEADATLAAGQLRMLKRVIGTATVEIEPQGGDAFDFSYSRMVPFIFPRAS